MAVILSGETAYAWKPYTHNTTALRAYRDAVDDGKVTILGRTYPVSPQVVTALRNWPQFYNAGVIGPDGFPDLTYGQAVIHPGTVVSGAPRTGAWLGHVLRSAVAAQSDSSLSAQEKEQILAFAFGFLTHGAGDMWGHTFINDFAQGVFPSVGEVLTDPNKAAIALRHIAAEGYVGDASPGFDGNQDTPDPRDARGPAPGGDISDDSTQAFGYDAPHGFIFRTLIDPAAATPSNARGPLIGFFLDLRSSLQGVLNDNPKPLQDAINSYDDTVAAFEDMKEDCNFEDVLDALHDAVACPIALLALGIDVAIDSAEAFFRLVTETVELAAKEVLNAYLSAWIDDIDDGLRHWSELGLASTRAFFDPQARRDLQNEECEHDGPDDTSSLLRANCEHGIGVLDTLLEQSDDFINHHLLSMAGAPDLVGDLREILESISDVVDDVIGTITAPFNPLREVIAEVKQFVDDLIEDAVSDLLGVNIEAIRNVLTHASRFTCLEQITFDFPAPLGTQTVNLFASGSHDRLDRLIGLGSDHHVIEEGIPPECGRLQDAAELDFDAVAATANTVTMSKLLLLDGSQLNQLLGDILHRQITTYDPGQNVMIEGLAPDDPWLRSIDSDHAWRQDGLPRFCDEGTSCPDSATARPAQQDGGAGNFPIWESCVLRPAFRQLFADWEATGFPEFGDEPSADPGNDPDPPTSTLTRTGTSFDNGSRIFVAADNAFTQTAQDGPTDRSFPNDQLGLQRRIFTEPSNPGSFADSFQGETFKLTGPDGLYFIGVRAADPCHPFSGRPAAPETEQVSPFFLDTTPPQLTCPSPPFGQTYDTASTITLQFSVSDGEGSGIAQSAAAVDGFGAPAGTTPTTSGTTLDLFLFFPGTRHVSVSSSDNLGNAATAACTFELHATVESLESNVTRAFNAGLINNHGTFNSLSKKLEAALVARDRGQTETEHNIMGAFIHELQAQSGNHVDPATADRFIAFAQDLIATGR
ncbi:MAG TPA: hypothetical protein VGD80_23175 [Kofleriaceae bacterium]